MSMMGRERLQIGIARRVESDQISLSVRYSEYIAILVSRDERSEGALYFEPPQPARLRPEPPSPRPISNLSRRNAYVGKNISIIERRNTVLYVTADYSCTLGGLTGCWSPRARGDLQFLRSFRDHTSPLAKPGG